MAEIELDDLEVATLEVAGNADVGGNLAVTGDVTCDDVTCDDMTVNDDLVVVGDAEVGGTMSVKGVTQYLNSTDPYPGRKLHRRVTVASGGTYDLDIRSDPTKAFSGILTIIKSLNSNPAARRCGLTAVNGRGTIMNLDDLSVHTAGGLGDSPYTLANSGVGGVVRLTDTGVAGPFTLVIMYDGIDGA